MDPAPPEPHRVGAPAVAAGPAAATLAAGGGGAAAAEPPARATARLWTWWTRANPRPVASRTRSQLAATRAGSSPTASPRFRVANGGDDTPPCRVVNPWGKPSSTRAVRI